MKTKADMTEYERQQLEAERERKSEQRFGCCLAIFWLLLAIAALAFAVFVSYIKLMAWWNLAHM